MKVYKQMDYKILVTAISLPVLFSHLLFLTTPLHLNIHLLGAPAILPVIHHPLLSVLNVP